MDDAHRVDVLQPLAEVLVPVRRKLLRRVAAFEHVLQRARTPRLVENKVHDIVRKPRLCVHVHVVDAHDARMRQAREETSLDLEALAQKLDLAVVERERLQREARAEPFVLHLVHFGHSALPERTHDAIGPNLSSSLKHSA